MANNARYINQDVINLYLQAGIDPKTGLPLKASKLKLPAAKAKLVLVQFKVYVIVEFLSYKRE